MDDRTVALQFYTLLQQRDAKAVARWQHILGRVTQGDPEAIQAATAVRNVMREFESASVITTGQIHQGPRVLVNNAEVRRQARASVVNSIPTTPNPPTGSRDLSLARIEELRVILRNARNAVSSLPVLPRNPVRPLPAPPVPPVPPVTPPRQIPVDLANYNVQILNTYRARTGAPPLVLDARLSAFALDGSKRLAADGRPHAHFSERSGSSPAFGSRRAENQGAPSGMPRMDPNQEASDRKNIALVMKMMFDEGPGGGHYDNIMNPQYRRVGVGLYQNGSKLYLTNNFSD